MLKCSRTYVRMEYIMAEVICQCDFGTRGCSMIRVGFEDAWGFWGCYVKLIGFAGGYGGGAHDAGAAAG